MKNLLENAIVAFAMYSKVPMPHINWTKENMKYAMCFFPLIGIPIGLLAWGWMYLTIKFGWNTNLRAAGLVLIPVLISGGIHVDGMLDTADALSSYKTQEEKLQILKDTHVGAFAIIVGICWFLMDFGLWSQARPCDMLLIGLGFMLSRAWSGLGVVVLNKAKNTGLLHAFADAAVNRRVAITMVVYICILSCLMVWADPMRGAIEALLAFLMFLEYRRMSYSKFGGITGDLAGFFVQMCEILMLAGVVLCG